MKQGEMGMGKSWPSCGLALRFNVRAAGRYGMHEAALAKHASHWKQGYLRRSFPLATCPLTLGNATFVLKGEKATASISISSSGRQTSACR